MGKDSKISWTDHTFSPWWGCARVSPGCENCYAETFSARVGHGVQLPQIWGVDGERRPMSDAYWREPLKWNRGAEKAGVRRRVFCASMADVFEILPERNVAGRAVQDAARARLWPLIEATPWLTWLLLTKRPENVHRLSPWPRMAEDSPQAFAEAAKLWPANVWIGTTVEDQRRASERIEYLLELPARVRFISCEPLLEPVDLTRIAPYFRLDKAPGPHDPMIEIDALAGHVAGPDEMMDRGLDWVIVGGESGPGARPFALDWARDIVEQCKAAGVACFVKQMGSHPIDGLEPTGEFRTGPGGKRQLAMKGSRLTLKDRKGGSMEEWPPELRVQEWPEVTE